MKTNDKKPQEIRFYNKKHIYLNWVLSLLIISFLLIVIVLDERSFVFIVSIVLIIIEIWRSLKVHQKAGVTFINDTVRVKGYILSRTDNVNMIDSFYADIKDLIMKREDGSVSPLFFLGPPAPGLSKKQNKEALEIIEDLNNELKERKEHYGSE
jgi:hypothetical protein